MNARANNTVFATLSAALATLVGYARSMREELDGRLL
jgi:hypothetical protein